MGKIPMLSEDVRVMVIGLDGATFDLILPWVRQGYLPAFKRLMENGSWGPLESTLPPMTGPAWSSFITGKNPGKHGIFDFMIRNPEGYNGITINASYRKGRSFWSLLEAQNKKAVIFNVPITYPPERLKGAMVSGFLTPPGAKDSVFPPELGERLEREVGPFVPHYPGENYGLGREEKFAQEIEQMTRKTIHAMEFLAENEVWDLFVGVIQSPDLLQHCLWKFEDREHPLYEDNRRVKGAFLKNYQIIDDYLGKVLKGLDDRTYLFVMSDHGFNYIEKQFFVNNWLLEEGFLVLKKTAKTFLKKILFTVGIVPMKVHKLSASLGMDLSKLLTKNRDKLSTGLSRWILSLDDVDWKRSSAYGMGNMGFINVNVKGREPQGIVEPGGDYERVVDDISKRLSLLKDPGTGSPLVSRILRQKDIYWGAQASKGPDLYIVMKDYAYCLRGDYLFNSNRTIDDLWIVSGSHRDHGILLTYGAGVKRGHPIAGANITDIAPTVLGLMGGQIPDDMDGRCLVDIMEEEKRKEISLRYVASSDDVSEESSLSEREQAILKKQLEGLGYLG